jgi:two-component system KDP operon response regulator KdpE
MYSSRIILVTRDPDIVLMCQKTLEKENIQVRTIHDRDGALDALSEGFTEAVVLDSSMDEDDLPGLCKFISVSMKIPVIVIGSGDPAEKRVRYLDSGAIIYIELPFNPDEFLAQVKAVLRMTGSGESYSGIAEFASGDLRIDYHRRLVTVKGKEVRLSRLEYELLRELTSKAGKTLSYSHLLRRVWGPEYTDEKQDLYVYIGYLRKKIEPDLHKPHYIINVPKVGYVFKHP